MRDYSQLADQSLLDTLARAVRRESSATADVLALIAEVDERRLYAPAGFPSMHAYCVTALHLSEDSAKKRIQAARAARDFPILFAAVADGRLHLSAVCLLAPYLSTANADELVEAASYKTKCDVEQLIAERFPRSESLPLVMAVPSGESCAREGAPGHPGTGKSVSEQASVPPTRTAPIALDRYIWQVTVSGRANGKLRRAQELLSHQIPSGDPAAVLERALDALLAKLERAKYATTERPAASQRPTTSRRHIPAAVRRAVRRRDGDQCTFVSDSGHRCTARRRLEFDHEQPVACGGESTVDNLRLRCRAHNLLEAERAFGAEFMRHKREAAHEAAEAKETAAAAAAKHAADEVVPYLRRLGYRQTEAKEAARLCEAKPDASLEQRVRLALTHFLPRTLARGRAMASPG